MVVKHSSTELSMVANFSDFAANMETNVHGYLFVDKYRKLPTPMYID